MRFDGKVALVTGAGSGIGRALVRRFVADGAAVVAVDIVEAALQAVVKELQEQGGKAVGCIANVADEADIQRMLHTATSTYGRLDILCNNAGIMDSMTPAADVSPELWNRVLAVNLTGPFLASRHAIPIMLQQGCAEAVPGRLIQPLSMELSA
jgi:NAD(P)-dependent dehydrogenase (short-subunit alcohol dehydrogenase family)